MRGMVERAGRRRPDETGRQCHQTDEASPRPLPGLAESAISAC